MTRHQTITAMLLLAVLLAIALDAQAVQVQDVVRIKGAESSRLVGMGLVVGLSGTGDGGKFQPAMRPLAAVIRRLMDSNTVAAELKDAKNVALVAIEANVPETGVREGDRIDVHVSAIGAAKSLEGGRLLMIPLTGPLPDSPVFAFASGPVTVDDTEIPTVGVVKQGAQMTRDIRAQFLNEYGQMTLVLTNETAGWPVAYAVADLVNQELAPDGAMIARAVDPKNVVVDVPMWERTDPAAFISRLLRAYVDLSSINTGARVVINEKTKTIIVGADVQISPAVISHNGLTITTVTPSPEPTEEMPLASTNNFIGVDPDDRGGTRLKDLLASLQQLQVEADDRIAIVKELHRSGKLHAKLIIE